PCRAGRRWSGSLEVWLTSSSTQLPAAHAAAPGHGTLIASPPRRLRIVILAALLHRGNREASARANGMFEPPKALAPALNLRFNLNKVPYIPVATFKTAGGRSMFRTTSSGIRSWRQTD